LTGLARPSHTGGVPSLARVALAAFLAAWTATVAAMPPCADDARGAAGCAGSAPCEDGETHDEGAGDCELGCSLCGCCRPPVAAAGVADALTPLLVEGRLVLAALARGRAGVAGDVFQPPRA
jgi:hypothetical protein